MVELILFGIFVIIGIVFWALVISFIVKKLKQHTKKTDLGKERILSWFAAKGISAATIEELRHMDFQQMHRVLTEQNLLTQQELNRMMNDPYLNQGLDLVIDSHYHGIDNGMEPSQHNQSNDFHNDNNSNGSGGGFNNGF